MAAVWTLLTSQSFSRWLLVLKSPISLSPFVCQHSPCTASTDRALSVLHEKVVTPQLPHLSSPSSNSLLQPQFIPSPHRKSYIWSWHSPSWVFPYFPKVLESFAMYSVSLPPQLCFDHATSLPLTPYFCCTPCTLTSLPTCSDSCDKNLKTFQKHFPPFQKSCVLSSSLSKAFFVQGNFMRKTCTETEKSFFLHPLLFTWSVWYPHKGFHAAKVSKHTQTQINVWTLWDRVLSQWSETWVIDAGDLRVHKSKKETFFITWTWVTWLKFQSLEGDVFLSHHWFPKADNSQVYCYWNWRLSIAIVTSSLFLFI